MYIIHIGTPFPFPWPGDSYMSYHTGVRENVIKDVRAERKTGTDGMKRMMKIQIKGKNKSRRGKIYIWFHSPGGKYRFPGLGIKFPMKKYFYKLVVCYTAKIGN